MDKPKEWNVLDYFDICDGDKVPGDVIDIIYDKATCKLCGFTFQFRRFAETRSEEHPWEKAQRYMLEHIAMFHNPMKPVILSSTVGACPFISDCDSETRCPSGVTCPKMYKKE